MDYITAPNTITDSDGRRQFADLIPGKQAGTDLCAAAFNPTVNEIVHVIKVAGLTPDANDETQLAQAIADGIQAEALRAQATEQKLQYQVDRLGLRQILDVKTNVTYSPGPDVRYLIVEAIGGGGGGGGAAGNKSGSASCGGAGAAGGYARLFIDLTKVTLSSVAVTIGAGGQGQAGDKGLKGGATSFGNYLTCDGGQGGDTIASQAAGKAAWCNQSNGGSVTLQTTSGITVLQAVKGQNGSSGFLIAQADGQSPSVPVPAIGAASFMGSGGSNGINVDQSASGLPASGFGGGGGAVGSVGSAVMTGGQGGPGRIMIFEYGYTNPNNGLG